MKKTVFVKDIKTLMQILTDPSKQLVDYHVMNDDVIQVEYKNTEDFECQSFNINVTIACSLLHILGKTKIMVSYAKVRKKSSVS